jgi:HPt (histidine-containing phosphotransfer) domain-containing protein
MMSEGLMEGSKDSRLVDFSELEEALDADGAHMLVEAFLEDTGELVARMVQAISERKAGDLKAAAHALKGCCASIMAKPTEAVSKTMQQFAIEGNLEAAERLMPTLSQSYAATAEEIKRYLG